MNYLKIEQDVFNTYLEVVYDESRIIKAGKTIHLVNFPVEDDTYMNSRCGIDFANKSTATFDMPLSRLCKKCLKQCAEEAESYRERFTKDLQVREYPEVRP